MPKRSSSARIGWPSLSDDLLEEIEFGFLIERGASTLLDRVQRHRRTPRQLALRPARVGGPARQLHGDRDRQGAAGALVQARTSAHAGRRRRARCCRGARSMFEYLMPLLVMRTLSRARCSTRPTTRVVERQIEYGAQRGVPWGISESAYNARDLEGNYQYRAFGVPGLGLKRGLADDLVVAPYATRRWPRRSSRAKSSRNLERLARRRAGRADTATTRRSTTRRNGCPTDRRTACVRADLHGAPPGHEPDRARQRRSTARRCSDRFHADPRVQAAELLLAGAHPAAGAAQESTRSRARITSRPCAACWRRRCAAT